MSKRIAAIVLPRLACELALRREGTASPFGVTIEDEPSGAGDDATSTLCAVDELAWRYGVRPGQRVAEASAFVGRLAVVRMTRAKLVLALESVAEIALGFGTTAALGLELDAVSVPAGGGACYPGGAGAGPLDTVWLDVTGCARLAGGEDLLGDELRAQTGRLGHRARVAIAGGPRIAQAVARWTGTRIVAPDAGARALEDLPVAALPLTPELLGYLGKLGILSIGDLAQLPRAGLAHRLGPRAQEVLELVAGRDEVPLVPYQPPRVVAEQASFEPGLDRTEPLLFVLRGLVAHAAARLQARGEACGRVVLELGLDRAIAARAQCAPQTEIALDLPVSLADEADLLRALHARIERLELEAPVVWTLLRLERLTAARKTQLQLLRARGPSPDALPALLAELGAALGPGRVGRLEVGDSHRPEARSMLVPIDPARPQAESSSGPAATLCYPVEPTRLLPEPIYVGKLEPGRLIAPGPFYLIDRLRLDARIDRAEWWTAEAICRDYARAWLHTSRDRAGHPAPAAQEHAEAWIYMDRQSRRGFLHGWYD